MATYSATLTTPYNPATDPAIQGHQLKPGTVTFDQEVIYPRGVRMAIQVIADPEDADGFWTQGVVFDADGTERGCTDVGESFEGEYWVKVGSDEYTAEVIRG